MTDMRRIDKCKECDAPIVWAKTSTGKNMPVDAEPAADGNVLLYPLTGQAGRVLAIVTTKDEAATKSAERYKSHFATCPEAASFRRKGRA